jgi:hypothetical protein
VTGIPIHSKSPYTHTSIVDPDLRDEIRDMLANLPELWPGRETESSTDVGGISAAKKKSEEAQKAAKARALMKMKKLQSSFAASISSQFDDSEKKIADDDEENLCIICRCDDADGDNGPMGYLGHVQRSRVTQLASKSTLGEARFAYNVDLDYLYRVVGDKGCQVNFDVSHMSNHWLSLFLMISFYLTASIN